MSYRPTIKNPHAAEIHQAYGITEERRIELSDRLNAMAGRLYRGAVFAHHIVDEIAKLTATKEEFAWAIFTHAMWLASRGSLQNSNPGDLIQRNPPPQN